MKTLLVTALVGLTASAHAVTVRVEATGTLDYNFYQNGPLQGIPAGSPAVMSFEVDSEIFVNSPNHPTRGYPIDQSMFDLTIGKTTVDLISPFPAGSTPYFVIRNNDPAVDGFFISTNIDTLIGVPLTVTNTKMNFLRTFTSGTMWPSLDILDCVGTYGFEFMSSYEWTLNVGPGTPLEIAYETISLTVDAPCPADITGNSAVDVDDLLTVINAWGACTNPNDCPADITSNDIVDVDDLLVVINSWGACP